MTAIVLTGRVRTFDPQRPWAAAVAVRDGLVVAVGDLGECRAAVPVDAEVIHGGLILPGFTDCHVHPLLGGLDLLGCDLHGADTAAGYLELIGRFAADHPDDAWIHGGGWSLPAFPGGLPTAAALDGVIGDRPAYLVNTDRHGAWVNTAALRLAGIDASTPDPGDGRVERDREGRPTGMLHEGATALVSAIVPRPTPDHLRRCLLAAQRHLHAQGVTAWQDAIVGEYLGYPDALPVYLDLAARGELTALVDLALWWDRGAGLDQLATLRDRRAVVEAAGASGLSARTVKIMVDGIVENRSAALHQPYRDAAGPGSDRGRVFLSSDDLAAAVRAVAADGFAAHLHAIGDRAVTDALDAIEAAVTRTAGIPSTPRTTGATSAARTTSTAGTAPRHHIAHLQLVAPQDVPRFGRLGVTANMQMFWAAEDDQVRDLCRPLLGDARVDRQYPFASLLAGGAFAVAGSDWPVSSASVLAQIQVGVTRRPIEHPDRPALAPEQALTLDAALRACTVGGAHLHGRDASLRPGSRADLVVLDRDLHRIPADDIAGTAVQVTIAGGSVVHRR